MRKFLSLMMATFFSVGMFAATTYTVAGSQDVLGTDWNTEDTSNDMELVEGVYTLVKSDVTLTANVTYKFKVVQDYAWTNAWPAQDKEFSVAEDGKYNVTFTFVEESKEVGVKTEKTGSAEIEKHYLVVGQSAIANGKNWDNNADVNLMKTDDNGVTYTLSIAELLLKKDVSYEYKIVEKGTWNAYYQGDGGQNAKFTVAETAVYTIKYVFTVATSQCEVQTTKTGDADQDLLPEVKLAGSLSTWTEADAPAFVAAEDKKSASLKLTLGIDHYQFKIISDGNWMTKIGGDGDLFTLKRDWPRADHVDQVNVPENNMKLITDVAGDYIITWTYADSTLVVTFPESEGGEGGDDPQPGELPVVKLAGSLSTWTEADAPVFEPAEDKKSASLKLTLGIDHYQFKIISDGNWMTKIGGDGDLFTLKRDWPRADHVDQVNIDENNMKLITDVAGDYIFTWTYADSTLVVTFPENGGDDPQSNDGIYLSGSFNEWQAEAKYKFARNEAAEVEEYVLSAKLAENDQVKVVEIINGEWGWYPDGMDNAYIVDADHAGDVTIYFQKNYKEEWKDFGGYMYIAVGSSTGISNTVNDVKVQKFIENGQLFIIVNGAVYTATGMLR